MKPAFPLPVLDMSLLHNDDFGHNDDSKYENSAEHIGFKLINYFYSKYVYTLASIPGAPCLASPDNL